MPNRFIRGDALKLTPVLAPSSIEIALADASERPCLGVF